MRLDLAIPAYNEAPIIEDSVRAVREALTSLPGHYTSRIIVCDNASTDGTGDRVRNLGYEDVCVLHVAEKGKGAAVIAAAQMSDAEYFGFIDADLSADPSHISELLSFLEKGADIAIASRLHKDAKLDRSYMRTLSSRAFNRLRRVLVGVPVYDSQCGLKLATRQGKEHLTACVERGWFYEVEWLLRAHRAKLTIHEHPITWVEFRFPERKSKLRVLQDGIEAIRAFLRIRHLLDKSN